MSRRQIKLHINAHEILITVGASLEGFLTYFGGRNSSKDWFEWQAEGRRRRRGKKHGLPPPHMQNGIMDLFVVHPVPAAKGPDSENSVD
jgi:hypothetical protein